MPLQPGDRIGRIRIEALLGVGGMGEVYRGFDERLERAVAVKVIHADKRVAAMRVRFLREARLLSRLDHPNICRIYDIIERPDGDYLVLELVEGETLRDRAARGLTRQEALNIALQVARVLAAAHAREIIHRDLKPDNVMIGPSGEIKVLDFGLARIAEEGTADDRGTSGEEPVSFDEDDETTAVLNRPDSDTVSGNDSETKVGSLVGTLHYMSPEQARGRSLTTASDIYSLGVVMYEMLGVANPYGDVDSSAELLVRVRRAAIERRDVGDRPLNELLRRLTAVHLSRRPTADETVLAIEKLIARPREIRKRWIAAALAAAIVAAIIGAVLVWQRVAESRSVLRAQRSRVAILPFRNATGKPSLQWVEVGLMQFVTTGLGSLRHSSIVPPAETLRVLQGLGLTDGKPLTPSQRGKLMDALGADAVIESTVVVKSDGLYTIRYAAAGRDRVETAHDATSSVLTSAAGEMARQLAQRLDPASLKNRSARYSADEYANMSYAIGEEERSRRGAKAAAKYFEVAVDRDPDFLPARIVLADVRNALGDHESAAALYHEAIDLAARRGDDILRGKALAQLATFEVDHSEYASGEAHARQALAIALKAGDSDMLVKADNALGYAAVRTNRVDLAESAFTDARRAAEAKGDLDSVCMLSNNLGLVAEARQKLDQAEKFYREGLAIANRTNDRRMAATLMGNIAVVRSNVGDPAGAEDLLRKQLVLARDVGDRETEIVALTNLAISLYSRGEEAEAIRYTEQAADAAARAGVPRVEAIARANLATARTKRGELAQAGRDAQAAVALLPRLAGDVESADEVWLGQAYWLIRVGRLAEAEATIARTERDWRVTGRSMLMRARLAYERGDYRNAATLIGKAKAAGQEWLAQYDRMLEAFNESARSGKRSTIAFEDPVR